MHYDHYPESSGKTTKLCFYFSGITWIDPKFEVVIYLIGQFWSLVDVNISSWSLSFFHAWRCLYIFIISFSHPYPLLCFYDDHAREKDMQSTVSTSFADISTYNPPHLLHIFEKRKIPPTCPFFFDYLSSDFELKLILSPSVNIIVIPVKRDHAQTNVMTLPLFAWMNRCREDFWLRRGNRAPCAHVHSKTYIKINRKGEGCKRHR